ncbi:phosphopyruvate hydratase [Candidatus Woesearchaeota archaeon]|nr:phosphopyruvate hydratase [Candidatus Woesearchaeota archaeon]
MPTFKAREILDSRGNPTLEVEAKYKQQTAREEVPSGASTGIHEALELRDKTARYNGKGVQKAVNNVKKLNKLLPRTLNPRIIDKTLIQHDNEQKSRYGANTLLGISLAAWKLKANKQPLWKQFGKKPLLPIPFMNIINGGKHATNSLSIQEFMIVPKARTFKQTLQIGAEVYHELKQDINKKYKGQTAVGDEGGFAPNLNTEQDALDLIEASIHDLGYTKQVKIALDAAASEFYKKGKYILHKKKKTPQEMIDYYQALIKSYPIISLEDPFEQDHFKEWQELTKHTKIQIVGDDLLVTNPKRIRLAIQHHLCNALLLKVNQIGTVTEAIEAHTLAKKAGWNTMVSHRSGETISTFIADLAVGLQTGQLKAGAPCRGERLAKYNQLLRIEENTKAKMADYPSQ